MKKFWIYVILSLAITAGTCQIAMCKENVVEYEMMIGSQTGNLISEDEISRAVLYGSYSNKGLYAKKLRIEIQDEKTGEVLLDIVPGVREGYVPKMQLMNFMHNGLVQIFLGMDTGGSGAYGLYEIYSVKDAVAKAIFTMDDYNSAHVYHAEYADGYRVKIRNVQTQEFWVLDISSRPQEYLSQLYTVDGMLTEPKEVSVSALNGLFPYFNTSDGTFQLLAYQRIVGLYEADMFGYMLNQLRYYENEFQTYYSMAGSLGYGGPHVMPIA